MRKILITDAVHPIMVSNFESVGFQCDLFPNYTNEEVFDCIEDYVGIIINSKTKMFKAVLDKAVHLEFIGRLGSGMEIIDIDYAKKKGIQSFSVPEGNRDAVAEHAMGMLLSLFNNLNRADTEVKQFIWEREKNRGVELGGKTIALIGYGNTGKALAKKISGFDVEVLAYDKYLSNYSDDYAQESSIENIFKKADIISFHLPLNADTMYLCDDFYINKFKKDVFVINTSRGKVINLKKILFQIKSKKIQGICLDVFENEKPMSFSIHEKNMYSKLYSLDTVILSPHVAGWTKESKYKIANLLSNKIIHAIYKK
jgi:D-3-phosphoglycerate dehydrogenase